MSDRQTNGVDFSPPCSPDAAYVSELADDAQDRPAHDGLH